MAKATEENELITKVFDEVRAKIKSLRDEVIQTKVLGYKKDADRLETLIEHAAKLAPAFYMKSDTERFGKINEVAIQADIPNPSRSVITVVMAMKKVLG